MGNAVSGLIAGSGAIIDANGNTEVQSLTVRGFLKATEYMLNRIQITEGAQWLTEGGVIEKVAETASQGEQKRYNITFRARFEGDIQAPFKEGDILRGQIAKLQGGAGIETSWLRVEGVNGRKVEVSLYSNQQVPEGRNTAPTEQMRVARWGNTIDATRRSHIVLDSERGQIVRRTNINAPIIEPKHSDGFSLGTLPSWLKEILGGAVDDKSDYLFARGIITQDIIRYTPEGKPLAERVDRGVWSAQQSYYHEEKNATTGIYEISRVWLDGTLYELAPRGNGSERPSANNTHWIVVQEKPRNGVDGANGERGRDGARGQDGRNGRDGAKGQDGKNGADGLTPMPNLLKSADFDPKNVSNDSARNGGFAWRAETVNGGIVRHEPNVMPPHAGAKVVSCESFQKSTWYNDVNCIASIHQEAEVVDGRSYTFSVYVKGADAGYMIAYPIDGTHFKISGANPIDEGQNTAEGWKRYAVTFKARSSGKTTLILRSWCNGRNGGNGGKVYFACPKLEESYRPTPWTRAQEDFRGAAMRPLGDWDALPDGFRFQSGGVGEEFIDTVSVKSEGALLWWSCKRSHAKTKDTRPNVNAPFWELGQNLKFVATDLLLAKKAFIENLGVRNVETRNAQGEVTFRTEENGDVFIGGKATIGGFRKSVPVVITPENHTQFLEEARGSRLYFSPFTIGTSFLFAGAFPAGTQIYISNTNPDTKGIDSFTVGSPEEQRYFAVLMQYLGTQVFVGNYTSGGYNGKGTWINIENWTKEENTIKQREVFKLEYSYKKTQPTTDERGNPSTEGLLSIWRPTKLTLKK